MYLQVSEMLGVDSGEGRRLQMAHLYCSLRGSGGERCWRSCRGGGRAGLRLRISGTQAAPRDKNGNK